MAIVSLMRRLAPVRGLAEQAGRTLLDALYPLECAGCGGSGKIICDRCAQGLPRLVPPYCRVCAAYSETELCRACAQSGRHFDGARSPYRYEGSIRDAILALKYGGIKAAAPQLAEMLADYVKENPLPGDVVAPVPMHGSRRRGAWLQPGGIAGPSGGRTLRYWVPGLTCWPGPARLIPRPA